MAGRYSYPGGLGRLVLLAGWLTITSSLAGQSAEIYSAHRAEAYGRALDRSRIERFTPTDFLSAPQAAAPRAEGILTAVTLNRLTRCTLEALTEWQNPLEWCSLTLIRQENDDAGTSFQGKHRYRLEAPEDHLTIVFSLERPAKALLDEVRTTYREEPEVKAQVLNHYGEGYVIRIYAGEDFNENGVLDFREALAAATLLGDTEQWLWGIRDGSDYLAPLKECPPAWEAGVLPCSSSGVPPAEAPRKGGGEGSGIELVPGFMGDDSEFTPLTP